MYTVRIIYTKSQDWEIYTVGNQDGIILMGAWCVVTNREVEGAGNPRC